LVDRVDSRGKRRFVDADRGAVALVRAAGERLLDDLVKIGRRAHLRAGDGRAQFRTSERDGDSLQKCRFVCFQLRANFACGLAGDVHTVDGNAAAECCGSRIDHDGFRAAFYQHKHCHNDNYKKRNTHAAENQLAFARFCAARVRAFGGGLLHAAIRRLIIFHLSV